MLNETFSVIFKHRALRVFNSFSQMKVTLAFFKNLNFHNENGQNYTHTK